MTIFFKTKTGEWTFCCRSATNTVALYDQIGSAMQ